MENKQWTAEEDNRLAKLRHEGLSAAQIGAEFGVSRNAVIGRVHRSKRLTEIGLGRERSKVQKNANLRVARLKHRASAKIHAPRVPAPPKAIKLDPIKITDIEKLRFDEERAREKITLQLNDGCKFCVNDPAPGQAFYFCGEVQKGESSYCLHHHARSASSGTYSERVAIGTLLRAA